MNMSPVKVFSVGIASAGTFSSAFTFPNGTSAAYLEIPSFTTSADFMLQGSTDGTVFRRVMQALPVTATVQANTFTIASSATQRMFPIPIAAPFMRVEMTTAPVSANTFNIILV